MRGREWQFMLYTLGCVFAVVLLLAPRLLNSFFLRVLTEALVFGMLAMSVNILVGYTGLAPLGHAGFFGVAAYTVGYLTVRVGVPHEVAVVVALGVTLAVSAVFGALAVRTTGIYFLMITLAQGMIIWGLAFRWAAVTGAENGIRGIARPEILQDFTLYYYVVLLVFAASVFAMAVFVNSPFGLSLQGIRENDRRMRTLGYNVTLHKFLGFLVSGFLAGLAGVLYVYYNNFVSPSAVEFSTSAEALLMVILGGSGTLIGPIIGSLIITFSRHILSLFTDRWLIVMGAIFVITILFAPRGIVGTLQELRRRGTATLSPAGAAAPTHASQEKGGESPAVPSSTAGRKSH